MKVKRVMELLSIMDCDQEGIAFEADLKVFISKEELSSLIESMNRDESIIINLFKSEEADKK